MSELNLWSLDGKTKRKFQVKWYNAFKWLCGSNKENKLYCFNCLLCGDYESIWCSTGIDIIKNFVKKGQLHTKTKKHLIYSEAFVMLGKRGIHLQVNFAAKLSAIKYNELVTINRKIIARLFDCVFFLAKQELSFRGHSEGYGSWNKGNYRELIDFIASEEPIIETHLLNCTVFKGTSSEIQNELIYILSNEIDNQIREELSIATSVSIQADETNDISCYSQLSVIFRYVIGDTVVERFIGFFDMSEDKSAESISNTIISILANYQIGNKLVSQTYDGASTMAGRYSGVNARVQLIHKDAIFVHCYAHQLNLVLLHGCKSSMNVTHFIAQISQFYSFFHRSSTRSHIIHSKGFAIPSGSDTRWNYKSRAVTTIKRHYQALLDVMTEVIYSTKFDPNSKGMAIGLKNILSDDKFIFYIRLFSKLFINVDHLFAILQRKISTDVVLCNNEIKNLTSFLLKLYGNEEFLNEVKESAREINLFFQLDNQYMQIQINEITCNFRTQLDRRFAELNILTFFNLLDKNKFGNYSNIFPESQLKKLIHAYPKKFDSDRLKNELSLIYNDRIKHLNPPELLKYIESNELGDVYSETLELLRLCLAIPCTSASSERSFSTLKRTKSYLSYNMKKKGCLPYLKFHSEEG